MILGILNKFALMKKLISPLGHGCVEVICEETNSFSSHMSMSQKNHTVFFGEFYRSLQGAVQSGF